MIDRRTQVANSQASDETVYVLVDETGDVSKFGGPKEMDADKLGEQLGKFSGAMSRALEQCKTLAGEFDLTEITLQAKLTTEFGFVLVSKAGVEGAVSLKFTRKGAH